MMQLLASILAQHTSNTLPGNAVKVLTLSGAGTSAVNGDYYTDANNPSFVAKHETNNYWIKIYQYHMGEGDLYSYCIFNNTNITSATLLYEWYCSSGIDNVNINTVNGASPAPNSVKANTILGIIQKAGTTACNGVYIPYNQFSAGCFGKHVFSEYYLVQTMDPDTNCLFSSSSLLYQATGFNYNFNVANGTSPAPIFRT